MAGTDAYEVVIDAIECKTPKRVPSFCLGADWDFMERFIAEVGFTYEEFKEFKKDRIPFICPTHVAVDIKLGADLAWMTSLGQIIWLDHISEPAQLNGGRFKVVTRMTTYEPPEGHIKRPVPHLWYLKEGLTTKREIQDYMETKIIYRKYEFKNYQKLKDICEKKYGLILAAGINGPWELLSMGCGFANVARFWRKDRKFLNEITEFHRDFALKGLERLLKYGKPDITMIGDDYGYNQGLLMSLDMWRELVKPTLIKYVDLIHNYGSKALLHSCGNVGSLFGDLIEIGFDGIESLKPKNNDLIGLKQKYGDKLALLGTIDDSDMLNYSTPAEVKKSVTQSIKDLGPGGYIPGATNFMLDQPVKNVLAMFEAINEYKI